MMIRPLPLVAALLFATAGVAIANRAQTPKRDAISAISPIAGQALRELEAERGAPFAETELDAALRSEAYASKYRLSLANFCAEPAPHWGHPGTNWATGVTTHKLNLACRVSTGKRAD